MAVDLDIHQIDITDSADAILCNLMQPAQFLDFGPVVVTKEDLLRLERILEPAMLSLSRLELSVSTLDETLDFILPVVMALKHLPSTIIINHKDGTKASFEIQPGSRVIRSNAHNDLQKTIPIPVLKVKFPVSLSEESAYVLASTLAHCPLVSEVAVVVDDLESAVVPFIKELPEQLQELSRLSVQQTKSDAMVSFFKQIDQSPKATIAGRSQADGVMIQTLTLPPTSTLLELPHVKELTLLSSDPSGYFATVSPTQVPEITAMVATAMEKFPELQSLDIKVKHSM
ncbi:hypothetical protein BGW39_007071 [Mortierella sp. 14UC]|nr:hypothetical protein BGW39_007071 [Mortierella sp. 14UC]